MAHAVVLLFVLQAACLTATGLAATCYGSFSKSEFPFCRQISPQMVMHWKVVDNEVLVVGVEADQVGGWMSVGISEATGGMPGGDMWVVTKNKDTGAFTVADMYAEDFTEPKYDESQDVELLEVIEGPSSTAAKLQRPLRTCDLNMDNRLYANESQIWLYAMSKGSWPTMHSSDERWFAVLTLQPAVPTTSGVVADTTGMEYIEMLMPDVTMTSNSTAFWCKNFKMPDVKKHVVTVDYVISGHGHEENIHHISLFGCYAPPNMTDPAYTYMPGMEKDEIYDCAMTGTPPNDCSAWLLNWFPGQEPLQMPAEAGMAVGPDGWSYLVLQVHYTNTEHHQGRKDRTGLRMYATENLRSSDMGMLWIGTMDFAIPPKLPRYEIMPGVCPSECLAKFKEPVTITWHSPHMHRIGKSFQTPHLRLQPNGELAEISPLNFRNHYGYDFQGISYVFPESNVLYPGDALISNCSYNSMKRVNYTFWGIDSDQEMCFNFVNYYPKQDIELCYPAGGLFKPGAPGIAYAYCTSAVGRMVVDQTLGPIPDPRMQPGFNWTAAQLLEWELENVLPALDSLVEGGYLVEFNMSKNMNYTKMDYSKLSCKQHATAPKLSVASASKNATPPAQPAGGSSGKKNAAGVLASWGGAASLLVALAAACLSLLA